MPTIKEMTMVEKEAEIKKTWKPLLDEHGLICLTDRWQRDEKMLPPMNRARNLGYKAGEIADLFNLDFKSFTRKKLIEDRHAIVQARRAKLSPEDELIRDWKPLIDEHGLVVLTREWQEENIGRKLMGRAGHFGYKAQDIAKLFELDFEKFSAEQRMKKNHDRLIEIWKGLIEEHGIRALSFCYAEKHGFETYLNQGYLFKLYPKDIAEALNKTEEYEKELVIVKKYPHDFAGKTEEYVISELRREWQDIYDEHGISALSSSWALDHGHSSLNHYTFAMDMSPGKFAEILGVGREFLNHRKPTKEKFDQKVEEVITTYGCLPSASFLSRNNYTIITHYMSTYGPTAEAVRERYGVHNIRLRTNRGLRCDSFSEVCFCNYLNAHGIDVIAGGDYPPEYAQTTDRKSGRYDPGFTATYGKFKGQNILVEIFGGGQGVNHGYEERKLVKIEFNKRFDNFLAIDFLDCYSDNKLSKILEPYIGLPERVEFHEKIPCVPATILSIADDCLRECQKLCDKMPDGLLPNLDWMSKTRKFKNRTRENWEPIGWSWLYKTISDIGWDEVRQQMKRTKEQEEFDFDRLMKRIETLRERMKMTPSQVVSKFSSIFGSHKLVEEADLMIYSEARSAQKDIRRLFQGNETEAVEQSEIYIRNLPKSGGPLGT